MPKSIFISLAPNVEKDDVIHAARTLLTPWNWNDPSTRTKVEQAISSHLGQRHVTLVTSGRAAMYHLLKGYGIQEGDEVIVQAFTCLAVPAPITWTGAKPVYADILPETYNIDPQEIEAKITDRTKAIVVQHTFGIPGPIKEVQQIAKKHRILLIEDLAHAFGSTYENQPLGTFGDAAIISFGRDKTISSVFGGAIVSADQKLIAAVKRKQETLPMPPPAWITQQLLHPILMSVVIPLYFKLNLGKILLVIAQRIKLLSKAMTSSEKRGLKPSSVDWQYPPALATLLHHQLTKFNSFRKHRQQIAAQYNKHFPLPTVKEPVPPLLRFPLMVQNPKKVLKASLHHHMMLGDWYSEPVRPSPTTAENPTLYIEGSCKHAEHAAGHTINLPTHPRINTQDAQKVIEFIKHNA